MVLPVAEAHFFQQLPALCLDLLQDFLLVLLEIRPLLAEKLLGQRDVLQSRVLGEEVKGLEHHAEVEPLFAHLALPLGGGIGGVKDHRTVHRDGALVGLFQKVQAPQQGGLSAAGGADDGQRLALLQIEADILQNPGGTEMLFNVMYFQNCHVGSSLITERRPASFPACLKAR